ncbi:hypothetical protein BDY21DRAFT_357059 [Lineolata rhizophorae]|uniref:Uncharacterized protein n=1 Tax=Lineolata rhizophorae TaxID=578093 RepID=A0A6A6NMR6_9PEZI|nr:hypothetical protein BDY21DRAFT_357059 [Lineolata rhizophorae]
MDIPHSTPPGARHQTPLSLQQDLRQLQLGYALPPTPQHLHRSIYKALFLPKLIYCCSVWYIPGPP